MKLLIVIITLLTLLLSCGIEEEQEFSIDNYLEEQTEVCELVHYQMVQHCYNEPGYDPTNNNCEFIRSLRRCPRIVSFILDTYERKGILLHLNNRLVDEELYCYKREDGVISCFELGEKGVYCYEYFNEEGESFKIDCGI